MYVGFAIPLWQVGWWRQVENEQNNPLVCKNITRWWMLWENIARNKEEGILFALQAPLRLGCGKLCCKYCQFLQFINNCCYRTRVRSLAMLVSDSLTHSLTNCCLVNLIDVTLRCEDANSKLVEVVTIADVGNSLLIWELTLGHKAKLLFRLWAQGLVKI